MLTEKELIIELIKTYNINTISKIKVFEFISPLCSNLGFYYHDEEKIKERTGKQFWYNTHSFIEKHCPNIHKALTDESIKKDLSYRIHHLFNNREERKIFLEQLLKKLNT